MSQTSRFNRIALFGDTAGLPALINHVPTDLIACLVASSIRPSSHAALVTLARDVNVPLLIQPTFRSENYPAFIQQFKTMQIDLILCNSYSLILRPDILALVQHQAINIHGSLLPQNRGPNPYQWAIIKGQERTGVTIHYMDAGLDTGDIIAQQVVEIAFEDTWKTLADKAWHVSDTLLHATLPDILNNRHHRVSQDEQCATVNTRLTPDFPEIQWATMSDLEIYNLIRAQVAPLKGAYTIVNGERVYFDHWIPFDQIAALRKQYEGLSKPPEVVLT